MLLKTPIALALSVAWGLSPLAAIAQQSAPATTTCPNQARAEVVLPDVVATGRRETRIDRKSAGLRKIVISKEEADGSAQMLQPECRCSL